MVVLQDGDSEGSLTFDPTNRPQAKLAIQTVSCKASHSSSILPRAERLDENGERCALQSDEPLRFTTCLAQNR